MDCLTSYAKMKASRVPGDRPKFVDHYCANAEDHIAQTREEFVGQPELCAYHAALIIRIRRRLDLARDTVAFFDLWRVEDTFLLKHLDSRWLVSALDTFADHGSGTERPVATGMVAFVNAIKLAETEYRLCGRPAYAPACIQDNIDNYPEMWDGRRVFHLRGDDTFFNTVRRMRRVSAAEPLLLNMFETLLERMLSNDTPLSRLAREHERGLW